MSSLSAGPWLSWSRIHASGMRTRPMGTLSQKIQCQLMPSTMAPPTRGPSATARPPMAPHAPSATPRRSARDRGTQQGQGQGHHERGSGALDGASDDERFDAVGQRRAGRCQREQRQAHDQHPPATEAVTQRGAGEQQHGEREGVGVDRPFEAFERGVAGRAGWSAGPCSRRGCRARPSTGRWKR